MIGDPLATLDLAWPTGLQENFSQPVALLFDEDAEIIRAVNLQGFRSFTETEVLEKYINTYRKEFLPKLLLFSYPIDGVDSSLSDSRIN